MQSKKYTLNRADLLKVGRNALIFLAPTLLVLFASFRNVVPQDTQTGIVVLFLLNIATDLLRKFVGGQ